MSRVHTVKDPGHRQPLKLLFADSSDQAPSAILSLPKNPVARAALINAAEKWAHQGSDMFVTNGVKWERGSLARVNAIAQESSPAAIAA